MDNNNQPPIEERGIALLCLDEDIEKPFEERRWRPIASQKGYTIEQIKRLKGTFDQVILRHPTESYLLHLSQGEEIVRIPSLTRPPSSETSTSTPTKNSSAEPSNSESEKTK